MKTALLALGLALAPVAAHALAPAQPPRPAACHETTSQFHAYLATQRTAGVDIKAVAISDPIEVRAFVSAVVAHMGKPLFDTKLVARVELIARSDAPAVFLRAIDAAGCTLGSGHVHPEFVLKWMGKSA